ncbi:fibronectin type III domain-containing protein [Kribbella sp. NPDC026611]|uniref:fibronectin type III domain-containing protein n=1 Tax=Kribbella sp. NPDC026611 TaxID=3154911 RepID=UPI0033FE1E97
MRLSTFRPRRLSGTLRRRTRSEAGLAAVVAGCVALMSVVVLTGAGSPNNGVKFTQSGHWVYNSILGKVFHLDGATGDVDSDTDVKTATPGAQVVQTDQQGYVLSRGRIDQFGKSDLTVTDPVEAPVANEQPVGLEAAGAAFAVFQQAGRVVRFGDKHTVAVPGGQLGDPVVTPDGTLWVHRVDQGDLCQLAMSADQMSCPASVPRGHKGGLSAVGSNAVFVDLTAGQVYTLTGDGIDDRSSLGDVDVPDTALVAGNDVGGKLAIVDAEHNKLHLLDISHRDKPAAPVTTSIPKGHYDKVASSGDGLALLDRKDASLITLNRDGRQVGSEKVPSQPATGRERPEPNLYRGDDSRVYVENGTGDRVVVVNRDGSAEAVEVGTSETGKPTVAPTTPKTPEKSTPPKTEEPKQPPKTQQPTQPTQPPRTETPRPPQRTEQPKRPTQPRHTERPTQPTQPTQPPRTKEPKPPRTTQPTPPATAKPTRPGAPLSVQARALDGGAVVTWKAAAAHGATVTSYQLTWTGGGRQTVSGGTRSATIPNLSTKTTYAFTISAVNAVGTGPAVVSNTVRLNYAPAESPRELLVKTDGVSGSLTLGWMAPTFGDGSFVRYEVSYSRTGPAIATSSTEQATVSGLTDGKATTFYVRAITKAGGQEISGKYSSLSAASVGAPQKTKRVVASRGDGTEYGDCRHPECAFVQVRLENLRPNTKYTFKPFTSGWGNFNPGYSTTTDSTGAVLVADQFPCDAVGQLTWVTVTGPEGTYTSNKFFWKSG